MRLKILTPMLAALGIGWAGNASAIVVGGIDFGVLGETQELETTTITETLITGDGQTLTGYGQVNTVNGLTGTDYCAVDAQCRLFFHFTDYTSTNFTTDSVDFTGGNIFVYYDAMGSTVNLLNQSSADNIAYITSQSEWVQLEGHADASGFTLGADGTLDGDTISFTGSGLLDVVLNAFGLAEVQTYLDGNGIPDGAGGFADKVLTTSGNNAVVNPFDAEECYDDGEFVGEAGDFCIQGSGDLRGLTNVVPEPGSLALLGLGLAGLGLFGRRRAMKSA